MKEEILDQFEIFPWHDNFNTGIDKIDEQHKKLVGILNLLAIHLANRSSMILLDKVFAELIDYTDYHFSSEEEIWNSYMSEDPWCVSHTKTHGSFIKRIKEIKDTGSFKPLDEVVQEIVSFLAHWLGYHILDTDKRMAFVVIKMNEGKSLEDAKDLAKRHMSGSMKVLIDTVLTMYDSLSTRTMDLMREGSLRKLAEKALIESNERIEIITEDKGDTIWEWDIENGEKIESVIHLPFFDSLYDQANKNTGRKDIKIHPKDIVSLRANLQDHLDGKTDFFASQFRILQPNHSWRWISSRGKVVERDENGTAIRMVGTYSDITEREIGSLIYHQSYQAIMVTDVHANIISINPTFTEITGYDSTDIVGKPATFLLVEDHRTECIRKIRNALKLDDQWQGETKALMKRGGVFIALTKISPIYTMDKTVDHYVVLFTDISEQKEFEKQLVKAKEKAVESDNLKTKFIHNLSHEIRTPMNGIIGFCRLMDDPDLNEERKKQYKKIIQESGNQLIRIIDDILEISRLDAGQVNVKNEKVHLNSVFSDYLDIFKLKASTKGITITFKPGLLDTESIIYSDESKLISIMSNLVENAVKFTNEGLIEVGYTIKNKMLELYVKDSGPGIEEKYIESIFGRFLQGDEELSTREGGLGLGLYITREHVHLLGGNIEVVSTAGKGSKFLVSIPFNKELDKI